MATSRALVSTISRFTISLDIICLMSIVSTRCVGAGDVDGVTGSFGDTLAALLDTAGGVEMADL